MAEEKPGKAKPPIMRWVLFTLAGLFAIAGIALSVLFYTSVGAVMKDTAYADGKQARILLEERTVEGNLAEITPPTPSAEETPEAAPPPPAPEQTPPAEEAPKEEKKPEEGAGLEGPPSDEMPGKQEEKPASASVADQLPAPKVKTPLNGALNPSLSETVAGVGNLPKISESGLESWQYYGKNDSGDKAKPAIAIIVTGLGLNHQTTGKALLLPEEVSLSFSPYAGQLQQQLTRARSYGHEVWLDLPLEPEDYPASDAGPLTLFKGMKEEEREQRLHTLLASAATYTGLVGTSGEIFSDSAPMQAVAEEIKSRGLLLILRSRRYARAETADHVFYVNRTLDAMPEGNAPTAEQLLVELEASAKESGYAVGALSDAPELYNQITQWVATLESKGLQLVPTTAIVSRLKK